MSVSVLTLTFIAYDRYNAICRPLQFSSRKTKAAVIIAVIWTVSGIIGIPDAVSLHLESPLNLTTDPCIDENEIFWDLSRCIPSWSENVDFFFTILKVSKITFSDLGSNQMPVAMFVPFNKLISNIEKSYQIFNFSLF